MSSEGSVTTNTSSRIRQFGLYRSIDARTEEFLRLSRKRQIRQGCACAAVSTAITVTVVVVVLLIYEYAIAVEWSLVQTKKAHRRSDNISDNPIADRLDRSYFGFDQDYYERMPLLVNAMQENSYVDPFIDMPVYKQGKNIQNSLKKKVSTTTDNNHSPIRRTSPRPFIYELRSPTPVPFSKTFGSKSWVESYRNAQRLKNIQQVIKYLEKTINAKVADALPSSTHIAFSGVYVEPMIHDKNVDSENSPDLLSQGSKKVEIVKSNHQPDPLFKFKPDTPSDVNMLADNYFRFLPAPSHKVVEKIDYSKVPMFKPIPIPKKPYLAQSNSDNQAAKNIKSKTFSVLLNLFPLLPTIKAEERKIDIDKPSQPLKRLDDIYFTTTRPQFRRKPNIPIRRISHYKRPKFLQDNSKQKPHSTKVNSNDNDNEKETNNGASMVLHINVFAPEKEENPAYKTGNNKTENKLKPQINNFNFTTEVPFQLSTGQVEDYHIGSSGIIPIEAKSDPKPAETLPKVTTMIPFFDITPSTSNINWPTSPPDVLKFSQEDAKIPDEYKKMRMLDDENDNMRIGRRNFRESVETVDFEPRMLVIKLRNDQQNINENATTEITKDNREVTDATTETSNTTQINGHYRNVNQKSKIVNSWLDPNSEENRKRRFELYAKGFRRPSFNTTFYFEIKRNNSSNQH